MCILFLANVSMNFKCLYVLFAIIAKNIWNFINTLFFLYPYYPLKKFLLDFMNE